MKKQDHKRARSPNETRNYGCEASLKLGPPIRIQPQNLKLAHDVKELAQDRIPVFRTFSEFPKSMEG